VIIPTRRLLVLGLGPALLGLLAVMQPPFKLWVLLADGGLLLLALLDLLSLPRRRRLQVERQGSAILSVGTENAFSLIVRSRCRRPLQLSVAESFPGSMQVDGLPAAARVSRRGRVTLRYTVVPHRRGAFSSGRTYVAIDSLLGLWRRRLRLTLPLSMKVFPDIKVLNTYALLARRNRIDLMGFRKTRGRAADVEFDRLRDYQPDDDHRRIDAMASARLRKLITREYEISRNQNVFFMVDCGRAMAGESGGLSNLDHALNATLMLSYLALDTGDNVGLLAFDDEVRTLLPLSRGLRSKTAVLHALYDLHEGAVESDYEQAFLTVNRRVRQRSLVVLLTNVMDSASFELLRPQLRALLRRHLPLVLLVRDADLFRLADDPPRSVQGFFERGAAAELATWRERMASDLQRLGALVLDLHPSQLTPRLINTYLQIKADQLL
jgi:uncharacterized protein (DUF58 family)